MMSRSSSSRRESNSPATSGHNHHRVKAVKVGCMPGFFQLLSKYHTPPKFLTFGKKQERQIIPSPPKTETTTIPTITIVTCKTDEKTKIASETAGRSSLEAPRSPVIAAEVRSSGSGNSPRVVARLMGIEEVPTSSVAVAEKRMKLLGALEKCNNDLKALKTIIDAVHGGGGGGGPHTPPRRLVAEEITGGEEEMEDEEEPSPVSVLDFNQSQRSPLNGCSKRTRHGQRQKAFNMSKQKPKDEEHKPNTLTLTSVVLPTTAKKTKSTSTSALGLMWSKEVVETVEEVCRDMEWGPRHEAGRIGLLIHHSIFKDLVEEIIKDMKMTVKKRMKRRSYDYGSLSSSRIIAFPVVEAYKRKLWF